MLLRFDPFRDLDRSAEQLFQRATKPSVPMDAVRRGDRVFVYFDLPGVASDGIDITVERNVLTLRAERRYEESEDEEVIVNERPQGAFTRQVFLGETLDAGKVEAHYDAGVLTLEIPIAAAAQPRRVNVSSSGSGSTAIDTESTDSTGG